MGVTFLGWVSDNIFQICEFSSLQKQPAKATCILIKHLCLGFQLYSLIRMLTYIHISDTLDFKPKNVITDEEGHYIIIIVAIQQEV